MYYEESRTPPSFAMRSSSTGELTARGIGSALWRRRAWILVPTLAVTALAVVGVNMMTPRYKSETRLLIEGRESVFLRPEAEKGLDRDRGADPEVVVSQVQVVLSRDVARKVVERLRLNERPEFDPVLRGNGPVRNVLILLGLARDPLLSSPEERILSAYYERVTAFQIEKSRVIGIEFQSSDSELAERGANAVGEVYLAQQQLAKQDQVRAAGQYLSGEIENLRAKVAEAEARVDEFRTRSSLFVGANNLTLSNAQLAELNSQLATARLQKAEADAKSQLIRDLLRSGRPIESADIVNSDLIRRLNEQRVTLRAQLAEQSSSLLDGHPRIKELRAQIGDLERQIRSEAERLVRAFEIDARIAGGRVEQLGANLEQLKRVAGSSNGQDLQLRALEREAKAQRDLLESYLAKYREATARETLEASPAEGRIISRALASTTPYFPKKLPIIVIAALVTMLLTAGIIVANALMAAAEADPSRPGRARVRATDALEDEVVGAEADLEERRGPAAIATPVPRQAPLPALHRVDADADGHASRVAPAVSAEEAIDGNVRDQGHALAGHERERAEAEAAAAMLQPVAAAPDAGRPAADTERTSGVEPAPNFDEAEIVSEPASLRDVWTDRRHAGPVDLDPAFNVTLRDAANESSNEIAPSIQDSDAHAATLHEPAEGIMPSVADRAAEAGIDGSRSHADNPVDAEPWSHEDREWAARWAAEHQSAPVGTWAYDLDLAHTRDSGAEVTVRSERVALEDLRDARRELGPEFRSAPAAAFLDPPSDVPSPERLAAANLAEAAAVGAGRDQQNTAYTPLRGEEPALVEEATRSDVGDLHFAEPPMGKGQDFEDANLSLMPASEVGHGSPGLAHEPLAEMPLSTPEETLKDAGEPLLQPRADEAAANDDRIPRESIDSFCAKAEGSRRLIVFGLDEQAAVRAPAVALARKLATRSRVVVIDLAFDAPSLDAMSDDPDAPGIADLVRRSATFGEVITHDRQSPAHVVKAGKATDNAHSMLQVGDLWTALYAFSRVYDHVVVNAGMLGDLPLHLLAKLAPYAVLADVSGNAAAIEQATELLGAAGFVQTIVVSPHEAQSRFAAAAA